MMSVVLVSLDVSVVNVALDAFRRAFAVRLDGLQRVLNVYTLTYAVLLLSAGALGDGLGSRTVFVIGSAVFTSASLLCGLAPSFAVLLVTRTVQRVGAALLVPSSMALLQQTFPDAKARARAVGLWAGAGSLAIAGGPVLGGALIAYVGWRGTTRRGPFQPTGRGSTSPASSPLSWRWPWSWGRSPRQAPSGGAARGSRPPCRSGTSCSSASSSWRRGAPVR